MTRGRLVATIIAVAIVTAIWSLLPPRARQLSLSRNPLIVRGAIHVHTTRSDGAGTPDEVGAAAHRAGLDFVILTDHGDGLRVPDPPRYVEGVLLIDAVEISTADGHLIALGIGQAPYRLAGDARDVVEDVHRLGGFGIAAHPDSPKPDLKWRGPDAAIDGLEWLNADSEWRNETRARLARDFVTYWLRGPESIAATFDRPEDTLAAWTVRAATRRTVAIGGTDAHARIPLRAGAEPGEGPSLSIPSYESSFRAMCVSIETKAPIARSNGSAAADAAMVLAGLRAGHAFTTIDGVAGPARLEFTASSAAGISSMGDDVLADGEVRLTATVTPALSEASMVIVKNSIDLKTDSVSRPVSVIHGAQEGPALYRVEVRLPGAPGTPPVPWIVGNPIYVRRSPRAVGAEAPPYEDAYVLTDGEGSRPWVIEKHARSDAHVEQGLAPAGANATHFSWRLEGGAPSGQYAALALPLKPNEVNVDALALWLQAPKPMRISVQLRVPTSGGRRWERSVYIDATPRTVLVPLSEMRAIEAADRAVDPANPDSLLLAHHADLSKADTLLLVVDTVNATPGSAGECWVGRVSSGGEYLHRTPPTSSR